MTRDDRRKGSPDEPGLRKRLYEVNCSKCGETTKIPFNPTGKRDILCQRCLIQQRGIERPPKPEQYKPLRRERTEFGTRVSRLVVCSRCGAEDRISFSPRNPEKALCRTCALEVHGILDPETPSVPTKSYRIRCDICGREDEVTFRPVAGREVLCHDCVRGIYSYQEEKATKGKRKGSVITVRRPRPEIDRG